MPCLRLALLEPSPLYKHCLDLPSPVFSLPFLYLLSFSESLPGVSTHAVDTGPGCVASKHWSEHTYSLFPALSKKGERKSQFPTLILAWSIESNYVHMKILILPSLESKQKRSPSWSLLQASIHSPSSRTAPLLFRAHRDFSPGGAGLSSAMVSLRQSLMALPPAVHSLC